MALKPCRECNKKVSTEASVCPSCGVPNPTDGTLILKEKTIKETETKKTSKRISNSNKESSGLIKSFWDGEYSLGQSFWGYGVLLNAVLTIPLFYANINVDNMSDGSATFFIFYFFFYIAAYIWINVGIWRSATYYAKKKSTWGGIAKAVVVLSVLNSIAQTII
tara:strand:+ start:79 stop:570 length:492 start_codon:yes stop_codon:yes gene_type:complete